MTWVAQQCPQSPSVCCPPLPPLQGEKRKENDLIAGAAVKNSISLAAAASRMRRQPPATSAYSSKNVTLVAADESCRGCGGPDRKKSHRLKANIWFYWRGPPVPHCNLTVPALKSRRGRLAVRKSDRHVTQNYLNMLSFSTS